MRGRIFLAFVFVSLLSFWLPTAAMADEGGSPAGISLDLRDVGEEIGRADLVVIWEESADEGAIGLLTPKDFLAPHWAGVSETEGSYRHSMGPVIAGEETVFDLDLSGLQSGERIVVSVDRRVGDLTYQAVASVSGGDRAIRMSDARHYLIRPAREEDFVVRGMVREESPDSVTAEPRGDALVVETLSPKVMATVFAENTGDDPISDNYACGGGGFPDRLTVLISSAPSGATVTAATAHVEITHPVMADLDVVFGRTDSYLYWPNLRFLWEVGDVGVNLNQDFTRDKFNNDWDQYPGIIGEAVNAYWGVWARDCVAGNTGTITYFSVLVTYDPPNDVDLVADTLNVVTDPAEPGESATVSWTGHVEGTGTVGGAYNINLYLSNDSTITTGDTWLATVSESTAVNPGDTFGESTLVDIPGGTADGTYHIGMIIDPSDAIAETNEGNNVRSDSFQVAAAPDEYDLVADTLLAQLASVEAGSSVNVNWFGHLSATSTADISGDFSVGFYLSTDTTINGSDTLLDRQTVSGSTSPGDSFGVSGHSLTIPGGTSAGNYYIGMWVDDTAVVTETAENNNKKTAAISITSGGVAQPDLQVRNCSLSASSVQAGGSVTLDWERRNGGTADSPAYHQSIVLSTDTINGNGDDTYLWGGSPSGLVVSSSWTSVSRLVDIPLGATAGNYYLVIKVDDNENVAESNENNNACSAALTVSSSPSQGVTRWLLPAAASAQGAGTSDWRTQVVVNNPTAQNRTATVYYVPNGSSWPGQLLIGPVNVESGESLYLDDPLAAMRDTTGFIYVDLDQSGPVVFSRTFNLRGDGSTFGQGIAAIPLSGASSPTELVIPLVHHWHDGFRTNLGLLKTSAGSMVVEIDIYRSNGNRLGGGTRTVSDAWDQFNVFNLFGLGSKVVGGGWIRVRLVGGSPSFWTCYASVIDEETDDGTFVPGLVPGG